MCFSKLIINQEADFWIEYKIVGKKQNFPSPKSTPKSEFKSAI